MLPLVVVGLSLSHSGTGSGSEELVAADTPDVDFYQECHGAVVNAKYELVDTNKCKWQSGTTTGPCYPL